MGATETPWVVKTQASNFTVGPGDFGAVHVITGAVTATLPAPSAGNKGAWVEFFLMVDEDFTISGGDELVVAFNNATADGITFGQTGEQIGNGCRAISDGSQWLLQMHIADEANTVTVVDA